MHILFFQTGVDNFEIEQKKKTKQKQKQKNMFFLFFLIAGRSTHLKAGDRAFFITV